MVAKRCSSSRDGKVLLSCWITEELRMELDQLRDPQRVSEAAAELGMVPMTTPAFLKLSDGTVLGVPERATGDSRFRLTPLPPAMPESFKLKPEIVYAAPVEEVVMRGLAKAPKDRYDSVITFAEALAAALTDPFPGKAAADTSGLFSKMKGLFGR